MQSRRHFIKQAGIASAALLAAGNNKVLAAGGVQKLTILHTNDVHSRVDPFPVDGGKYQGLGGCARREALIKKIRAEEPEVLLLDAGDIFQGTPYFNMYGGELELKLMSQMGYDAATMGNHDFDNGLDGFYKQLPHAKFPIVVSNYDFGDTILNKAVKPYYIIRKGGIKTGIFGLGIELAGLVDKKNYGDIIYNDPIPVANKMAAMLRHDMKCDLVICLSHLGYSYGNNKVSDSVLAATTDNIDLIIGGHTHTFLPAPVVIKNKVGGITTINQVGFAGINLGRIDFYFNKLTGKYTTANHNYLINNI